MTIDWHTGAEGEPSTLEYKKVGPAEWEVDIDEETIIWRYVRKDIAEWKEVPAETIPDVSILMPATDSTYGSKSPFSLRLK